MCDTTAAEKIVRAHEDLVIAIDNLSTILMENETVLCGQVFFTLGMSTLAVSNITAEQALVVEGVRANANLEYSQKFMDHYHASMTNPIRIDPINPNRN